MKITIRLTALTCLLFTALIQPISGQHKKKATLDYIDKYSNLAVEQQQKYDIPASIKLAQAIIESGAGNSALSRKSNNHFGIKCHGWKGSKAYHNDDRPNECFRAYKSVKDSYVDHSEFLRSYSRYAPLFKLKITDYKGWAKGLQTCGYATDPAYANSLIKTIETYELYRYDTKGGKRTTSAAQTTPGKIREVYKNYGLKYITADDGDTYEEIAQAAGMKLKTLLKYNEVPEGFPLQKGDIVYLQKKKTKADKPYYDHRVEIGESMHSISQHFGIRLKNLYKLNKKDQEYIPTEGDVLRLR